MATWIITSLYIKFNLLPKSHDWYQKPISLSDWLKGETKLCKVFDVILYVSFGLSFGFLLGQLIN